MDLCDRERPVERRREGVEDLLFQVVGIRAEQAALAGRAPDQRGVNLDELGPGLLVAAVTPSD